MAPHKKQISPRRIRSDLYSFCDPDFSTKEYTEIPCIISVVSSLLDRIVVRNDRQSALRQPISPPKSCIFHATRYPKMSIERYLEKIFKYMRCSPSVFVVAYAYIDRLIKFNSTFQITSLNVHRLLITSVMLAAKFIDDVNYSNSYYAQIGGLTTRDINKLEIDFLFKLDFRLQVTVSVFQSYCAHLEREVALGGGYQIERALRFICGNYEGCTQDDSQKRGYLLDVAIAKPRRPKTRMSLKAVRV
eukprot:Gb_27039 [translate_table: standard]